MPSLIHDAVPRTTAIVSRARRYRPAELWMIAGLVAFTAILTMVLSTEGLAEGDRPVLTWLVDHRTGWTTRVLQTVSSSALAVGGPGVVLAAALTVGLLRHRWRPLVTVVAALGGAALLSTGTKLAVGRARPSTVSMLGTQATGWSFPSGHTLLASVLVGVVVLLTWPRLRTRAGRCLACVGAATAAVVMGLSRLYLGDHWLTDVLASYALSALVLGATAWSTSLTTRRGRAREAADSDA